MRNSPAAKEQQVCIIGNLELRQQFFANFAVLDDLDRAIAGRHQFFVGGDADGVVDGVLPDPGAPTRTTGEESADARWATAWQVSYPARFTSPTRKESKPKRLMIPLSHR